MHFAIKERYFDDMVFHTMPQLFNLRKDAFETYDLINGFHQIMETTWVMQTAIGLLAKHLERFKGFSPRQESASFDINKAIRI